MNILANLLSVVVPTIKVPAAPISSVTMSYVQGLVRHVHGDDSYTTSTADMLLIADLSAEHYATPMLKILEECTRIDADTGELITRGYVVFEDECYGDEATAKRVAADADIDIHNDSTNYYETNWNDYSCHHGAI